MAEQSIEETYRKLSEYERIIQRPDSYVGGVQANPAKMWLYDGTQCYHKEISMVEGLYKIIDEIITNASDHHYNTKGLRGKLACNEVRVLMNAQEIAVWNNGRGIPIEVHAVEQMYVPQMIFGNLGTSSNYTEERKTGGKNGLGAKLTNIFSKRFTVETVSAGKRYVQHFEENMSITHPPVITALKKPTAEYTRIIFTPDFAYFGLSGFDEDFIRLVHKRCMDISICYNNSLRVVFNEQPIAVHNLVQYVQQCYEAELLLKYNIPDWTIVATLHHGTYQEKAHTFVNCVNTYRGGTHYDYIYKQIEDYIQAKAGKEGIDRLGSFLKNRIVLAINARVVNPAFDSQSKVRLKTSQNSFGSKCNLPAKFLQDLFKALKEDIEKWKKLGLLK